MLAVHPRTPARTNTRQSKGKGRICKRNKSKARTAVADRDKEEQDDDEPAQAKALQGGFWRGVRLPRKQGKRPPTETAKASTAIPACGAAIAAACFPQHARELSSSNTGAAVVAHANLRRSIPNLPLHPKRFPTVGEIAGDSDSYSDEDSRRT